MAGNRLPNSFEAEKALLGSMVQHPSTITEATDQGLDALDFYYEPHQIIYHAIIELHDHGKSVDLPILTDYLKDQGQLDSIGGTDYLAEMMFLGKLKTKDAQYIEIIKDKAQLRQLIAACEDVSKIAKSGSYEVDDVLAQAESKIRKVTEAQLKSEFKTSRALATKVVEDIMSQHGNDRVGVQTRYSRLDRNTNGFQKGDLIILAARTSVGKTAFAVNVAVNSSVYYHKNVAYFSLEMSGEQIISRMLAVKGQIASDKLRTGKLDSGDENSLYAAENDLSNAGLYIDDNSMTKVSDIFNKCHKLQGELMADGKSLDLILVDYLQLIQVAKERDSRQQDVSEISRGLKQLARELNCPVIALSQLSRESVKRGVDKRPQLSDLRESGAIEQDADLVIFLHNPNEVTEERVRKINLIVGKQRNGALMDDSFMFDTETGIFDEEDFKYQEGA